MSLQALLRAPPALRPLLVKLPRAGYHSYDHATPRPYGEAESAILSSALSYVPSHGFTHECLSLGAKDAGYLDVSTNLFPRGTFEIVVYHLVTQRLALKDRVQFPDTNIGLGAKVRSLIIERLRANIKAGTIPRWQEAVGIMSLGENISPSLKELAALSDEIWFLAGDTSVDSSWYSKRASLSGVYAATEIYQTSDQSTNFKDTEQFLDRRLEELRLAGSATNSMMEWLEFQGSTVINLLRSKGVRI